jgi:hypothetical protein
MPVETMGVWRYLMFCRDEYGTFGVCAMTVEAKGAALEPGGACTSHPLNDLRP